MRLVELPFDNVLKSNVEIQDLIVMAIPTYGLESSPETKTSDSHHIQGRLSEKREKTIK